MALVALGADFGRKLEAGDCVGSPHLLRSENGLVGLVAARMGEVPPLSDSVGAVKRDWNTLLPASSPGAAAFLKSEDWKRSGLAAEDPRGGRAPGEKVRSPAFVLFLGGAPLSCPKPANGVDCLGRYSETGFSSSFWLALLKLPVALLKLPVGLDVGSEGAVMSTPVGPGLRKQPRPPPAGFRDPHDP